MGSGVVCECDPKCGKKSLAAVLYAYFALLWLH